MSVVILGTDETAVIRFPTGVFLEHFSLPARIERTL